MWLPQPPQGQRLPRVMTPPHPLATGSYGPELLEWARPRFGMHPKRTDSHRYWQSLLMCAALQHDAAGNLLFRNVILGTARQCGKSWGLRELCMWRIEQARRFGELQTVVHAAAKLSQAEAIWKPAAMWAARQPKPSRRLSTHPGLWDDAGPQPGVFGPYEVRRANGSAGLFLPDGSGWIPQAANDQLGVSQSVGLAVVDEAWDVPRWVVDSGLAPTQAEAASPQLWVISTAGRPRTGEVSDLYQTYRARALAELSDPHATLIMEWSASPDSDPGSTAAWRAASPHWDARREALLADEWVKAQAGPAALSAFRLNWLNQWPDTTDDVRWLPQTLTDAAEQPVGEPPSGAVAAVDVALSDRASHAVALAWTEGDRIHASVTFHDGLAAAAGHTGSRQLWAARPTVEAIGPRRWGSQAVTAAQQRAATAALRDAVRTGKLRTSGVPPQQWANVVITDSDDGQQIAAKQSGGDVHAVRALSWAVWAIASGREHSGFLFGAPEQASTA